MGPNRLPSLRARTGGGQRLSPLWEEDCHVEPHEMVILHARTPQGENRLVTQFSVASDANLNAYEKMLGGETLCSSCQRPKGIIPAQKLLEQQYGDLFIQIFTEFDRNVPKGTPTRFICEDGYVLARQVTDPEKRLEEELLYLQIQASAPSTAEAEKLWRSVTDLTSTRTINQTKLAKVIKAGKLKPADVQAAMVKPKPVTSRHRRKATKEDMDFLKVTGDLHELLVETDKAS